MQSGFADYDMQAKQATTLRVRYHASHRESITTLYFAISAKSYIHFIQMSHISQKYTQCVDS